MPRFGISAAMFTSHHCYDFCHQDVEHQGVEQRALDAHQDQLHGGLLGSERQGAEKRQIWM